MIIRARNLRAAANFIPAKSFRARKVYYSNEVRFSFFSFFVFVFGLGNCYANPPPHLKEKVLVPSFASGSKSR